MKTLKLKQPAMCLALFTLIYISAVSLSFAQETQAPPPAVQKSDKQARTQNQSSEQTKKDYDDRMQKIDEMNQHLQRRAQNAKDPQMKADIATMQSKIDKVKADMQRMDAGKSTMSAQELSAARTNLHTEMEDLKNNYEQMKTKYGSSKGEKAEKGEKGKLKSTQEPVDQTVPKQ